MAAPRSREYARIHRFAAHAADEATKEIPDEGTVGFGYILISPGNSGFARWLRNNAGAYSQTSGLWRGTHVRARTGKQSYEANYVWARTYVEALKEFQHLLGNVTGLALCRAD
jgi:hypothetical protein